MKKILMALMLSTLVQSALAFDYSSYTVTWTDAKKVVHTDPITQKATDPRHIIALLKELYCNPVFPGNINVDGAADDDENKAAVPYTGKYYNREVEAPYEDGFTCVLVECVENTSASLPNTENVYAMGKCIKSVQLIPDVAENEDAYIFSINGQHNFFYIAAKGKARPGRELWWERLGATGNTGQFATNGLYDALEKDGVYALSHDCSNLPQYKHYFTMEQSDTVPYIHNMTVMVPKKRMKFWDQTTHPGFKWPNTDKNSGYQRENNGPCWYNPDYYPRIALYHAQLNGGAMQAEGYDINDEQKRNFTVSLNWTSNLKNKDNIAWTGGETYELYQVNEDGTETLIDTFQDLATYSCTVAQKQETYKLHYKVVCYPTNDEGIKVGPAETNVLTVAIPGFNDEIALNCEYRSRFEEADLKNSYKNTLQITLNGVVENATNLTISRKNANDDNTTATVATVAIATDGTYAITYNNALAADDNLRFDSKALTLAGNAADGIAINDYFLASTENGGDLSGGYVYSVAGLGADVTAFVPVYCGSMNSAYNTSHHIDDVFGDNDAHLALTDKVRASISNCTSEVKDIEIYKNSALTFRGTTEVEDEDASAGNSYTGRMTHVTAFGRNTYGTNRVNPQVPAVSIGYTDVSNYNYENSNLANYGATLRIEPTLAANSPYVYYYRVWRLEEVEGQDAKITELNTLKELVDTVHATPQWGTSYRNIKNTFPRGEMADQNAGIVYVHDIYTTERTGSSNMVSYIVRMYTTNEYQDQNINAVAASNDNGADFFNPECLVSENSVIVTFDNRIVTGVVDMNAQKEVSSVRYTNLLGATSDQPFNGVNIVVTTYTDGTQSTVKMCK